MSYADSNNNGTITQSEIIEESNYYPFGLKHKGYNNVTTSGGNSTAQKYGFGGKELQDELNLDWHDFGARNYMPDIGRWTSPDPLTERVYEYTPYNYVVNNPITFVDPTGQWFVFFFEEGEKGDKQREYMENTLNKLLGDQFSVGWETNSNGSKTLKLNKKKGGGDKGKLSKAGLALVDAATDENVVSLINITENDEGVNVGSFSLQRIDIDDVKKLSKEKGGDTSQGLIVHELVEQHEKSKEGIDVGKIFKNGTLSAFKKAHKKAIGVENSANGNTRLTEHEGPVGTTQYVKYFKELDGTITKVTYSRNNKVMQVTKKSYPKGSKPWKE